MLGTTDGVVDPVLRALSFYILETKEGFELLTRGCQAVAKMMKVETKL